jgi:hypothetical protein
MMTNNNPLSILSNMQNNPLFSRAQLMAKGKSDAELEQIAKNICKEKGIDYTQAMSTFKQFSSMFNLK